MNILLIVFIIFLVVISSILVWINLPGTFIFLFCAFFLGLYSNFEILSKFYLFIVLLIYIFLELIEFLLSFLAIKIYGGKKSSIFYSIAGGLIGAFIGSLVFPIVGSFCGLILGSYFAIYYNEKRLGSLHKKANQIALSTVLSYSLSKGLKCLGIIFFAIYILKIFNSN